MSFAQPTPGSDAALDQGCTCPVLDNARGRGIGNPPDFWISGDCPLHGNAEPVGSACGAATGENVVGDVLNPTSKEGR